MQDGSPGAAPDPTHDAATAALLLLADVAPRLAGAHLLCVDGPSGAGKSTFGARVARRHHDATLLHLDALMDGWDGLGGVAATLVRDVLEPLAAGRPARWRRYDWVAGRFAEQVPLAVRPGGLLVVEGVGAGDRVTAEHRSALVWLEAAAPTRRARALARPDDGDAFAPHWDSWARQEAAHHAQQDTRSHADLVVRTD